MSLFERDGPDRLVRGPSRTQAVGVGIPSIALGVLLLVLGPSMPFFAGSALRIAWFFLGSLLGAFLLMAGLVLTFGLRTIAIDRKARTVTLRTGFPGARHRETHPFDAIERVAVRSETWKHPDPSRPRVFYVVELIVRDGPPLRMELAGAREEAEAMAKELAGFAGWSGPGR